jgi:predicted secreted protein
MFDDQRSHKLVMVSHCLLNQNSISDGTADLPSQFDEIVACLMKNRVGIIQLPCPEMLCLGLDRGNPDGGKTELLKENTRIRGLMEEAGNAAKLKAAAEEIARQIEDYRNHGFEILGLIGVDRSPSCGIVTTSRHGREEPGRGAFIDVLAGCLARRRIEIPMVGTRTGRRKESLTRVKELIRKTT